MIEKKIRNYIEKPLKEKKISIEDIFFEEKEGVKCLVIVIDKSPYVDMNTCVEATHIINPLIDELDLIDESYYLEVCSKGVEE